MVRCPRPLRICHDEDQVSFPQIVDKCLSAFLVKAVQSKTGPDRISFTVTDPDRAPCRRMHLYGFGNTMLLHPVSDRQCGVHAFLRPEHETVAEDFVFIFQKGDDLVRQKRHPPLVKSDGHAPPRIRKKDLREDLTVRRILLSPRHRPIPDRCAHLDP